MELARSFYDEIIAHARQDAPDECCGVLAGDGDGRIVRSYRATNIEHSPYRYNIDPKELLTIYNQIEGQGWELRGIYHSHTSTEAYPSPTDVRLAGWPDAYYLIVSLKEPEPVLRAFRITEGTVGEEPLPIVED